MLSFIKNFIYSLLHDSLPFNKKVVRISDKIYFDVYKRSFSRMQKIWWVWLVKNIVRFFFISDYYNRQVKVRLKTLEKPAVHWPAIKYRECAEVRRPVKLNNLLPFYLFLLLLFNVRSNILASVEFFCKAYVTSVYRFFFLFILLHSSRRFTSYRRFLNFPAYFSS